jgi:tetratricopeptide (TPR) repeat protein
MIGCDQLDAYLDRSLGEADRAQFEAHARTCPSCAAEIRHWRHIEVDIVEWAEGERGFEPSPQTALRLVQSAQRHREHAPRPSRWPFGLGFAVAAAAAALLVVWVSGRGPESATVTTPALALRVFDAGGTDLAESPAARGAVLESAAGRRVLVGLGDDRVAVAPESRVVVDEAQPANLRLRLVRGRVALAVAPRRRGEVVEVEAAGARVRVVGTRFGVALRPQGGIEVEVNEGRVHVSTPGGAEAEVVPGRSLRVGLSGKARLGALPAHDARTLDALLDQTAPAADVEDDAAEQITAEEQEVLGYARPAAKRPARRLGRPAAESDDLGQMRQWILEGRLADAEQALEARLARRGHDAAAWSLLADCRRKAGKLDAAVRAYREVIRVGDGRTANRARFLAASILQDELGQHQAAVALLRAYLDEGQAIRPLEAAAQVRLARSLGALGQRDAARELLERVADEHAGTAAADEARRLLAR